MCTCEWFLMLIELWWYPQLNCINAMLDSDGSIKLVFGLIVTPPLSPSAPDQLWHDSTFVKCRETFITMSLSDYWPVYSWCEKPSEREREGERVSLNEFTKCVLLQLIHARTMNNLCFQWRSQRKAKKNISNRRLLNYMRKWKTKSGNRTYTASIYQVCFD